MRTEAGRHCAGAAVRVRQRAGGAYVTPSHWPGDLLPLVLRGAKDEAPTHESRRVLRAGITARPVLGPSEIHRLTRIRGALCRE